MKRIPPAGWIVIGVLIFTLFASAYLVFTATTAGFTAPAS